MSSSSNSIISLKSSVLEIASYTLLITLTILLKESETPLDGSILVNDKPIDVYALGKLRQKIAVVPQDLFLYAMSIKDNICIGKLDATLDEVKDLRFTNSSKVPYSTTFPLSTNAI